MTCLELFEQLDAYRAGSLARSQAEAVEQHLLGCDSCRADFHFYRRLRSETGELPRSIHPPDRVWRGVEARIHQQRRAGRPIGLAWWQSKPMLAAAAVVLMVLSSGITAVLVRQQTAGTSTVSVGDFQETESAYREATQELARTLETRRKDLSPAALAVIEQNLRIIDEAIRETEDALAKDPRNQGVAALLWATYEKKIDLLKRAAQHAES